MKESVFNALTTLSTLSEIESAAVGTNFFFGENEANQLGNTALRHKITYHQRIAGDGSLTGQGSLKYRMVFDILESDDTGDETKTTTRRGRKSNQGRDDDNRLKHKETAYSSSSSSSYSISSSSSTSSSSTIPENWVQKLDNTFWEPVGGYGAWDGTKWVDTGPSNIVLAAIGTWANGYRPTKVRITYTSSEDEPMIFLVEALSTTIGGGGGPPIPAVGDITFVGENIASLNMVIPFGVINVTNIEFLEPSTPYVFVPTPTPTARYDASLISALHNAKVPQWSDMIASAHLLQTVDAKRPLFQALEQAGKGVLKFSEAGVERFMSELTLSLGANVWIFCVMRQRTWEAERAILDAGLVIFDGQNDSYKLAVLQYGSSPDLIMYRQGGLLINSNVTVGKWHVVTWNFNGASSKFRVDGGNETIGNPGSAEGTGYTLGALASAALGNPDTYALIDVAEFIVYNGTVDPTDNELGLMTKWGIG